MNEKPKKKKIVWKQYIAIAFFMLIGAVCGFLMAPYIFGQASDAGKPLSEKILSLTGLLLGMYVAILVQLIIHEAGHLVFGLLSGYRFSSFRIFSFMRVKDNGKLRLKRLSIASCIFLILFFIFSKVPFLSTLMLFFAVIDDPYACN